MICLGVEEIDESQINEIGSISPELNAEDFIMLDEYREPKVKKRKMKVVN